jgi:hypothetical protein
MPDPVLANLPDQLQHPHLVGFNSPSTSSPLSPSYQFTPHLGNAQIPDLKNVMFPSDNPFAYPSHQTMSALESSDGQYSFSEHNMTPTESSMFGTPSNGTHQQLGGFQPANWGWLPGNPSLPQEKRDINTPFTDVMMQNSMGNDMNHLGGIPRTSEPISFTDMNNATSNPEEFWKDMGANAVNMDQGLTQDLQPANLDYFGSENWNPPWSEQQYTNQFHA